MIQNFQTLIWLKNCFTILSFFRTMFSIVNILETFAQDLLCWKSEMLATENILIWVMFFCETSYKPQYLEHSHTFIHSFNKYLLSAMHWPSLWGISRNKTHRNSHSDEVYTLNTRLIYFPHLSYISVFQNVLNFQWILCFQIKYRIST